MAAATDLAVLQSLIQITRRCCRSDIGAGIRTIAEHAGVSVSTAWRAMRRLAEAGWVKQVDKSCGAEAAIWRIRVAKMATDRPETILRDRKACNRLFHVDPCDPKGRRGGRTYPAPFFDHDLFRSRGLGKTKARIYALLVSPLTARQIADTLCYKYTSNVRVHLRRLGGHGLVLRLEDGRYERGAADLDALAVKLGVKGTGERQRARHDIERASYRRWLNAFHHWRQTGEIVDPESGEILGRQRLASKRARMNNFRQRVSLIRATRTEVGDCSPDDPHQSDRLSRDIDRSHSGSEPTA
jgi:hypothetical protein